MALYRYLANNSEGKKYKGILEAKDENELHDNLKDMGFYLTSAEREKVLFTFISKKVESRDLVVFSRQFSTLISAGIPLVSSLRALEKQSDSPVLRNTINDVRVSIEGGVSLSDAMVKHSLVFSDFFIALIRAGETGGKLDKVLERLADHLEKQDHLKRTVRGAFAYPIIVGILALGVVSILIIGVVPVFKDVYERMHLTLPGPTLALIGLSNFVRHFWWVILLILGGTSFSYTKILKFPVLRKHLDILKMNMPVFGKLIRKIAVARFVRTFGSMLASGVGILESLRIAERAAANRMISEIVLEMTDSVNRGGLISEPLHEDNIFPNFVAQMIVSGEESGNLTFMLEKSADGLDRDVDDMVKRLVVKIEPLMTFLLALVVGFIAVSIYLPIFDVIKEMN